MLMGEGGMPFGHVRRDCELETSHPIVIARLDRAIHAATKRRTEMDHPIKSGGDDGHLELARSNVF